jgi:hypothetical protein
LNGFCPAIAVVGWEKDEEEMNKMVDICPKEYKDRSIKVETSSNQVLSKTS